MLTHHARERCAHVIALTDSMASPLAGPAHDVLIAPAARPVLVIEALVASLMISSEGHVQHGWPSDRSHFELPVHPEKSTGRTQPLAATQLAVWLLCRRPPRNLALV